METDIAMPRDICSLVVDTIYTSITFITSSYLRDRADILSHVAMQSNNSIKVVTCPFYILLPNNNRIVCISIGKPHGIQVYVGIYSTSECKFGPCGIITLMCRGSSVPTAKRVSISRHRQRGRYRICPGVHKVGSFICCPFTVLVVNDPVSFEDIHLEHHIAGYGNVGTIGVVMVRTWMSHNMSSVSSRIDKPTLKKAGVIARHVGSIYRIATGRYCSIGTVQCNRIGIGNGIVFVQVSHISGLEQHGVEVHLGTVGDAALKSGLDSSAHLINGHTAGCISYCIGVALPPAFARHAGGRCAHSGVIDYGVVISLANIRFLYIEGHISSVGTVEGYFQTGIVASLGDDIYREGLRRERYLTVLGRHCGYVFDSIFAFVVDVIELAILETGVGHGHDGRLLGCRLPLAAVFGEVDVVGAVDLLAIGRGAHHGSSAHRSILCTIDLKHHGLGGGSRTGDAHLALSPGGDAYQHKQQQHRQLFQGVSFDFFSLVSFDCVVVYHNPYFFFD